MDFPSDYAMTIDGRSTLARTTIPVVNRATGQPFAEAPDCAPDQLDAAVAAARPDTPFAGHKQSGFGVENGMEGLLEKMTPPSIYFAKSA